MAPNHPVFQTITELWRLYSRYVAQDKRQETFELLLDLLEGPNGLITIIQRLPDIEPYQIQVLAKYTATAGVLILLAQGYCLDQLEKILTLYLDLLIGCKADQDNSGVFINHLDQLQRYLTHLLGAAIDPDLLIEVQATIRELQLQLNLPYQQVLG